MPIASLPPISEARHAALNAERFAAERALSVDTAAAGGNAPLLASGERGGV